jgi:hypothetical protein
MPATAKRIYQRNFRVEASLNYASFKPETANQKSSGCVKFN